MDMGVPGPDAGKGGKHIILPPDWKGEIPAGYYTGQSTTYRVFLIIRSLPLETDQGKATLHSLFELKDVVKTGAIELYFGPSAPCRQRGAVDQDQSRQGLVRLSAPLRTGGTSLRRLLEAGRFRSGQLNETRRQCLLLACAVKRRRFPVGARPTRQPLQPEAIGAVMEATKWLKPSISVSRIGDSAGLRLEDFAAGRLDLETSKNQGRAVFDVTAYPLFQQALAAVPPTERHGPLVTDEGGRPVKRRYYLALYREVADAAGVPRAVWNMHARHGGTTEAQQAGVALQDIAEHAQHSNLDTTRKHYIVPTIETSRRVARQRVAHRKVGRDKP
jgi:hypothetical protein